MLRLLVQPYYHGTAYAGKAAVGAGGVAQPLKKDTYSLSLVTGISASLRALAASTVGGGGQYTRGVAAGRHEGYTKACTKAKNCLTVLSSRSRASGQYDRQCGPTHIPIPSSCSVSHVSTDAGGRVHGSAM